MGTSSGSVNALKSRALEVALSSAEANALEAHGITSLARLAFAAGQTPTDAQRQPLLQLIALNPGNTASLKRLVFESQTLACNEVKIKANRKDDASTTFAGAGRDARNQQQKGRLTGLRFRGEEECCHSAYDVTLNMLERNCLLYLGPEKFPTRRHELLQKKPGKEISIDQSQLVVKEKQSDLTCPTVTELEVSNAFKRRALAFDLVGVCTYDVMAAYHAELLDHLDTLPPRVLGCFSATDFASRQSCLHVFGGEDDLLEKECLEPILQLPTVLSQPNVSFHLLPLSGGIPKAPSAAKASNPKKRSRSPRKPQPVKGKGGPKGRSGKSRGPNIPAGLINKALETPQKQRQMVVAKPKQEKVAPRAFTYVPSRGVSNPTRFKTIVEAIQVSPMAGLYQDSRTAKFLH